MERLQEKPLTGRPFDEVRQVEKQYVKDCMGRFPINGVGIGIREDQGSRQFVLRVYLGSEPTPEQQATMPEVLDEVPVLYEVTGKIQAL